MRILLKLVVFVALVGTGCLLATAFGVVHDQISYTIGPEYFTRLKFHQFAYAGTRSMHPRMAAAMVGALAMLGGVVDHIRHWRARPMKSCAKAFAEPAV